MTVSVGSLAAAKRIVGGRGEPRAAALGIRNSNDPSVIARMLRDVRLRGTRFFMRPPQRELVHLGRGERGASRPGQSCRPVRSAPEAAKRVALPHLFTAKL